MLIKLMRKELKEYLRTGKFYILLFVFLFFAILSPIAAKFMPELIKSMSQGISIIIPSPTWRDSLLQFNKNLNQIIFIVIVIVFIGSISEEKSHGTALIVVVKGVDRRKWVISKFLFQFLLSVVILAIAFSFCYYYAKLLFPDTQFNTAIASTILFLIYLFFVISLTIFSSSIGKNSIQSAGIFFSIFILINLLNLIPKLNLYNPMALSAIESKWISSEVAWKDAIKPIVSAMLISAIFISSGAEYFYRQEL